MIPDLRGFDDGVFPNEDMVTDFERVVRVQSAMQAAGRPQDGGAGDVGVSADGDCDGGGCVC